MAAYSLLALACPWLHLFCAHAGRASFEELAPAAATAGQQEAFKEVQIGGSLDAGTSGCAPTWLQQFSINGLLFITKVLGDSYTPKTLLSKNQAMIRRLQTVEVKPGTFPNGTELPPEPCQLLDRAGREDGQGETVAQIWKCTHFDYIIVAVQRATGSKKYLWQSELEEVRWDAHWGGLPETFPKLLRIRQYEAHKLQKLWTTHGFRQMLVNAMNKFPGRPFFFTGASRGATLSEVIGLRFALEFREDPGYRMPFVVSTGAYRWTNSVGRDLLGYLLPEHFAHILLARTDGETTQYDFVSRFPARAKGFVDVAPQFALDVGTVKISPCVSEEGCPGDDLTYQEMLSLPTMSDIFVTLHKSINFIRALRQRRLMLTRGNGSTYAGCGKNVTQGDPATAGSWQHWKQESCDRCRGVPLSDLMEGSIHPSASRIGCLGTSDGVPIPECLVDSSTAEQAAGHPGDIIKLRDGMIAKRSRAMDLPDSSKAESRRDAALNEWSFYMQTWCISKLAKHGRSERSESGDASVDASSDASGDAHPLNRFALGLHPWAPRFYGMCQISSSTGDSQKYTMMEDLTRHFRMPSVLDIKVGQTTEMAEDLSLRQAGKKMFQDKLSRVTTTHEFGARLAGYKVWNPAKKKWKTRKSSAKDIMSGMFGGAQSMEPVFDEAFKYLLRHGAKDTKKLWLTQLRDKARELANWWQSTGIHHVRCYAASLFFVWEGEPTVEGDAEPVLKFIDYAHFYAHENLTEQPDDDVSKGLSTVVAELERLVQST